MVSSPQRLVTRAELAVALEHVRQSPPDNGEVQLLVRRPGMSEREAVDSAHFDTGIGLVGDNWFVRGSRTVPDGLADPAKQVTMMNTRAADAVSFSRNRWAFAGDQIYADLDMSVENLPAGTRLRVGSAVLEVTDSPHLGCAKFTQRFGLEAMRWVSSDVGTALRLRGVNLKVVESGSAQLGDVLSVARRP